MAAETLARAGLRVSVYERKPSVGRKFLMAGRGGLNITHSEDIEFFLKKYGAAEMILTPSIKSFSPPDLRTWCAELGQETFVGSSGRVFPKSFKSSPLLRAWLARLDELGVQIHTSHEWKGWNNKGALVFENPAGEVISVHADATLLALGGASWPRLGSDGGWVDILRAKGIAISPLRPANCGFAVQWSDVFRSRYAGQPVKPLALTFGGKTVKGEMMISEEGIEGGGVYALSAPLRDEIEKCGSATLFLDLQPDLSVAELSLRLAKPQKGKSYSTFLRSAAGLSAVATGLLMESTDRRDFANLPATTMASRIKAHRLILDAPFALDRAISTAGGISFDEIDDHFMLKKHPGIFIAGEMLDWEAPTGGYLLQATFSTAISAANGILAWLADKEKSGKSNE